MPDLADGDTVEIKGSAAKPYILKNVGGVYSCTCPAWRNQSIAIERRTCKHLRKYRGDQAEQDRIGGELAAAAEKASDKDAALAPPLLLAQSWTNDMELSGWWMSEKLDGVRAYWTGNEFRSRLGNLFHAPDWFVEQLPRIPLDGELWMARKSFQRTISIVRRQDKSDHWRELTFVVFDAPDVNDIFERRLEALRDILSGKSPRHMQVLEHQQCRDIQHLSEELARIDALGGEGLMLRQPGSRYEAGRSSTLLKVKRFHDAEATVLRHMPGAGRHQGRLGALLVQLPDGTQFSVGTGFTDAQRTNPPPVGSQITFRYQELTDAGVPRFPSFVRMHAGEKPTAIETSKSPAKPMVATRSAIPNRKKNIKKATVPAPDPDSSISPNESHPKKKNSPKKDATMESSSDSASSSAESAGNFRHFEFVDAKSAKFWEICHAGVDVTVRFGRLGTKGQTQTKTFADEAAALKHANKLIAEKTSKGYQEC